MKRLSLDDTEQARKKGPGCSVAGSSIQQQYKIDPNELKPVDKNHVDLLINFIMRLACTVSHSLSTFIFFSIWACIV